MTGLIGERLGHSYSRVIHALLGDGGYRLIELAPAEVEGFLRRAAFKGMNVTIPYKETVIPYCRPDGAARRIGSVNTVVNRSGALYGYNTDYFGFSFMAKQARVEFDGARVVILGSGGTSKTARCVALDQGARAVTVVSRSARTAAEIGIFGKETEQSADDMMCGSEDLAVSPQTANGGPRRVTRLPSAAVRFIPYEDLPNHADADILINTTPVGMFPNVREAPPVALDMLPKLSGVLDVVYNPLTTRLVQEARRRSIPAANGLGMLAAQAVKAHALFFGLPADGDALTAQAADITNKARLCFGNIVLVGMPGCGKTSVGKALARRLARPFADTDACVEAVTGRRVPDIITLDGEAVFREMESAAVAKLSETGGQVIATGGGAVLSEQNRAALSQNGAVVFLNRPVGELSTYGRPLSTDVRALYAARLPVYRAVCDAEVPVAGSPSDVADRVCAALGYSCSS